MSGLVGKLKAGVVDPGSAIKRRVAVGKIKVLLTHPFTGFRLLRMKTIFTDALPTLGVDGTHLFVNPHYLTNVLNTPDLLKGVLWHEGAHIWMFHHLRRGTRDPHFWNLAGDGVINWHAIKERFTLPSGHISFASLRAEGYDLPKQDKEYTTESLYDALVPQGRNPGREGDEGDGGPGDDSDDEGQDGDDGDTGDQPGEPCDDGDQPGETGDDGDDGEDGDTGETGDGEGADTGETSGGEASDPFEDVGGTGIVIDAEDDDGESLSGSELSQAERELASEIHNDAQNAKSRGKLPASIAEYVKTLRDAVIDWREKLARILGRGSDYRNDWTRLDKKAVRRGLFAARRTPDGSGNIVVSIDTSASVRQDEYQALMAEVKAICSDVDADEVTVIYCDSRIAHVDTFDDPSQIQERDLGRYGGGGTDFRPPFDYVEDNGLDVDTFIYLSDLECSFPDEPDYAVVWVSTTDKVAPWGETIKLDKVA